MNIDCTVSVHILIQVSTNLKFIQCFTLPNVLSNVHVNAYTIMIVEFKYIFQVFMTFAKKDI